MAEEVTLTKQQVEDLAWLLSKAEETLEELDTFKSDLVRGLCEAAAETLLDRLHGKEPD